MSTNRTYLTSAERHHWSTLTENIPKIKNKNKAKKKRRGGKQTMQSVTKIRTPLPRNSQRTDASSSHYYFYFFKIIIV